MRDLSPILDEVIDYRYKGFPTDSGTVTIGNVGEQGWNLLSGDLLPPVMALKESAVAHNIALMAGYCRENGLSLAPHAKTPMAPQIVDAQLDAGAWAVTVATVQQAAVMRAFGVTRLLIANEVVDRSTIRWVAGEMERCPEVEIISLVDSLAGVCILSEELTARHGGRPLPVLVELGTPGGRAGCRSEDEALALARAVHQSPHLALAGMELYEGVARGTTIEERLAAVDGMLCTLRTVTDRARHEGLFDDAGEIIVSAGGSLYFDRVAALLGGDWDPRIRVVVRSGSYFAHDVDSYQEFSPLADRGGASDQLQPAMELWSTVLSVPEPGRAIAGFGKRDSSHDLSLPFPFAVYREGEIMPLSGEVTVEALNDQHAFLRVDPSVQLCVGDLLGSGISHPCTAFDKWRLLPLVDDDYNVVGAIKTYF
ncbi:MAG TPA: amino acid deaminase [Chloroflexota bacterium]|nr:amino acid deaminase [Chloroflexota bacterium]